MVRVSSSMIELFYEVRPAEQFTCGLFVIWTTVVCCTVLDSHKLICMPLVLLAGAFSDHFNPVMIKIRSLCSI